MVSYGIRACMLKDFAHGVTLKVYMDDSFYRIYILKMTANDNRFNPNLTESLNLALTFLLQDLTKYSEHSFALILTGTDRFFSNGLDLKYLLTLNDPNQFLIKYFEPLLFRFLTIGIPTVALLNGHAFAGGMCLALALDFRLAPSQHKSLLSMNELLINAAIPAGMLAILRSKLACPKILRDCIYARRWTVIQAAQDQIIDYLIDYIDPEKILTEAIEFAKSKATKLTNVPVLQAIKEETYREACALLLDPNSDKMDPFRFAIPNNKL